MVIYFFNVKELFLIQVLMHYVNNKYKYDKKYSYSYYFSSNGYNTYYLYKNMHNQYYIIVVNSSCIIKYYQKMKDDIFIIKYKINQYIKKFFDK